MKINDQLDKNLPLSTGATGTTRTGTDPRTGVKSSTSATTSADAGSTVALSSTASTLLSGTGGDFDTEKVNRISAAIADGSYKINADAIADKLISNAQELLKPASH
ncbi:MAG: flagellar biosynthesis anti-sigma factor FlgM [Janthinobacterium lividum]